jgi:hypothetical protein
LFVGLGVGGCPGPSGVSGTGVDLDFPLSVAFLLTSLLLVGEGNGVGVGLTLGEGDMFVVTLLLGAELSLDPHPLQRMKVSSNENSTINFFIISSKSVRR